MLHFFFTIAFVIVGPYTTATLNQVYQKALANSSSLSQAIIALIGCIFTDVIALCHLILFFWCLGDSAFGLKPRPDSPAKELEESQPKGARISKPISVIKNPPPASDTEKAMVEAKAAILGEKRPPAVSDETRSSLSLSIFGEKHEMPRVSVGEVKAGTLAEHSPITSPRMSMHEFKSKVNPVGTKPATSSPLRQSAVISPRSASPLSTSREFQQQFPRLSQDLNSLPTKRVSAPVPPDPPAQNSTSKHSSRRLSWRLRNSRSQGTSQPSSPEASRRSSQQQPPHAKPDLQTFPSEKSTGSSALIGPSSIPPSIPTPKLPAPEGSPKAANISVPRDPKLPTPTSTPPPLSSRAQSPSSTTTGPRPRPFSWRGSADVIEVVKMRLEPLQSQTVQTPPSIESQPSMINEPSSNTPDSGFVAEAVSANPPEPVFSRNSESPTIRSRASVPTITAPILRSPGFAAEVLFAEPPETATHQVPQPPPVTTQVQQPPPITTQVPRPALGTIQTTQPLPTTHQATQPPANHRLRLLTPSNSAPEIRSSSGPQVRTSNFLDLDGSVSQPFTLNQVFPTFGHPESYRDVEQMTFTPGSAGVSPQMLRMNNVRRLSEPSSPTPTAPALQPSDTSSKKSAFLSLAAQARNAQEPKSNPKEHPMI